MLASEILDKAADLVARPNGWCQRRFGPTDYVVHTAVAYSIFGKTADANCLMGALRRASTNEWETKEACVAIMKLVVVLNGNGMNIAAWNDCDGRTQEEVVAVLRAAAILARRDECKAPSVQSPVATKQEVKELEYA